MCLFIKTLDSHCSSESGQLCLPWDERTLWVVSEELLRVHALVYPVLFFNVSILMISDASDTENIQKTPKCRQRLRDLCR